MPPDGMIHNVFKLWKENVAIGGDLTQMALERP